MSDIILFANVLLVVIFSNKMALGVRLALSPQLLVLFLQFPQFFLHLFHSALLLLISIFPLSSLSLKGLLQLLVLLNFIILLLFLSQLFSHTQELHNGLSQFFWNPRSDRP